jgi:hypothetical protein
LLYRLDEVLYITAIVVIAVSDARCVGCGGKFTGACGLFATPVDNYSVRLGQSGECLVGVFPFIFGGVF